MNLVIVESPAKAKTIKKYLGPGFNVLSSFGHIRDLPKNKLGVDTEANFKPTYVTPPSSRKRVSALKKAAQKANLIFFATDEDREGEAIAWHLTDILKPDPKAIKRITFDEITKKAIQSAVKKPRQIDMGLVNAQQARRILDRLVGYELSPLLWKKVRRGLSAGRVQSVTVRLIVEREEEINAFKKEEFWTLSALLSQEEKQFTAKLYAHQDKKLDKLAIKTKQEIDKAIISIEDKDFTVTDIRTKETNRNPLPPFTTSTLQQTAFNQLGFSSKKTMMLAQQLYEGIELGNKGPTGLITYMRTDSTNLATKATNSAKQYIKYEFGGNYTLSRPRIFKKKSKGAQEAHEAIRPTDPGCPPETISSYLTKDQLKLYQLIWQRLIASQMASARLKNLSVDISAGDYTFRATGTTVIFDGFLKIIGNSTIKETILPPLSKGDQLVLEKLVPEQHFTQPPPRYSEATLVKALEEHGIGRPSTYAPIIDTIQKREYVVKNDEKRFAPTEVGTIVTKLLVEHFPFVVDIKFTAEMEESLDKIASGNKKWQPVIRDFYAPFHKTIKQKDKELNKADITHQETNERCPDCNHHLVIKLGRFGRFKACSNYPDCKHTEPIGEEKELQAQNSNESCPECGQALVLKRGRFGPFLGCSGYPDCKHIKKIEKSTGVTCPACGKGEIVEKRSRRGKTFYACNKYPDCKNAYWSKPTGDTCPNCQSLLVFGTQNTIRCSNKECQYTTTTTNQE